MRPLRFTPLCLSLTMLCLSAAAQTTDPAIPVGLGQSVTFGMIGLASGQTARVSALGMPMPGPILMGSACMVTLTFFDEAGKTLASSTLPVLSLQAIHFDLKRSEIDAATDRRQIRAAVSANLQLPPGIESPVAFGQCTVFPTLEIFNEDGRATTVLTTVTSLSTIIPLLRN